MPLADQGVPVRPADVEHWLDELGLTPEARTDREGVTSWDLRLDGRRRFDVPITLILDPALALIVWVHFAPPIGDGLRKSYRTLLRWNDEFPFAKFAVSDDERPLLTIELPIADAPALPTGDQLGLALARMVGIADRLLEESADWLWFGGKIPDQSGRERRNAAFLERYDGRVPELEAAPTGSDLDGSGEAPERAARP